MLTMDHDHSSELIDQLGGTRQVARICEVTSQAVSKWRRDGIPRARLLYLRAVRPDAFAGQPVGADADKREVA